MSSLTTTTINTKNATTDLTLSTGNSAGPVVVVSANRDITLKANVSSTIVTVNTTAMTVNTSASVSGNLSVQSSLSVNSTVSILGNASVNATISAVGMNVSSNSFTLGSSSLTANGYSRLPNGLLMQWGTVSVNTSAGSITFPAAFSSVYSLQVTPTSNVSSHMPAVTALSTTTASVRSSNTTANTNYWIAIGV